MTMSVGTVVPDSVTNEYPSVECNADAADVKGEKCCITIDCKSATQQYLFIYLIQQSTLQ